MDEKPFDKTVLPSGLTVYHRYANRPWFYAQLLCDAGQRRNPKGKIDLAHYVEHMLHTGIAGFANRDLIAWMQWLKQRGLLFELGSTGLDEATYGGQALVRQDSLFFRFLAALTRCPRLDRCFDEQRDIIRAERTEAHQLRVLAAQQRHYRHIFGDSQLAEAHLWASDEEMDRLTPEDVRAFHQANYGLAGMKLVVIGGLKAKRLHHLLARNFQPWADEPPAPTAPPKDACLNHAQQEDSCLLNSPEPATSVSLEYSWYLPPTAGAPISLLADVLEALLMIRLRERAQLAYDICVNAVHQREYTALHISSEVSPDKVKPARQLIEETLDDDSAVRRELPKQQQAALLHLEMSDDSLIDDVDEAIDQLSLGREPTTLAQSLTAYRTAKPEQSMRILEKEVRLDRSYLQLTEW